jgi:hypothetical protein
VCRRYLFDSQQRLRQLKKYLGHPCAPTDLEPLISLGVPQCTQVRLRLPPQAPRFASPRIQECIFKRALMRPPSAPNSRRLNRHYRTSRIERTRNGESADPGELNQRSTDDSRPQLESLSSRLLYLHLSLQKRPCISNAKPKLDKGTQTSR